MGFKLHSLAGAAAVIAMSFPPGAWAQDMSRNVPTASDAAWAQKVAQGGAAEVRLGEMAHLRSTNQAVKELAQRLVADHTKAGDELKLIATRKGITLPATIDPKHEALAERLSKLTGAEFDRAYVAAMVDDHRAHVADFQRQADTSGDPELKSFAIKTLPILQEHLRMAETLLAQVEK